MARVEESGDTEYVGIDELKSECLELCSEILSELDKDILPVKKENFTTNEDLALSNQATVRHHNSRINQSCFYLLK